jgi:hypothetical protein
MFSIFVGVVAVAVFTMYIRHDLKMRKQRKQLPPPPPPHDM